MEELDLEGVKEYMIGFHIVSKIYEIRDNFLFADEGSFEYNEISLNLRILDAIREVNFVFVKDVGILEDIKTYTKVGNLLNLSVYLDPSLVENKVIFKSKELGNYELKVNF